MGFYKLAFFASLFGWSLTFLLLVQRCAYNVMCSEHTPKRLIISYPNDLSDGIMPTKSGNKKSLLVLQYLITVIYFHYNCSSFVVNPIPFAMCSGGMHTDKNQHYCQVIDSCCNEWKQTTDFISSIQSRIRITRIDTASWSNTIERVKTTSI